MSLPRFIYICHAGSEKSRLKPYIDELEKRLPKDVQIWIDRPHDVDPNYQFRAPSRYRAIEIGNDWRSEISRALTGSGVVLAFWTEKFRQRFRDDADILHWELEAGKSADKLIIVRLDRDSVVHHPYRRLQFVDLPELATPNADAVLHLVVDGIVRKLAQGRTVDQQNTSPDALGLENLSALSVLHPPSLLHQRTTLPRSIWLHFLDYDVIDLFKLQALFPNEPERLLGYFRWLTSIACLFARDQVAVPAAGFLETNLSARILEWHAPFAEAGMICATGGALHADEYMEKRASLVTSWPERHKIVVSADRRLLHRLGRIWARKPFGTTEKLVDGWDEEAKRDNGLWHRRLMRLGIPYSDTVARSLLEVPKKLSESAFTAKLAIRAANLPQINALESTANLILSRQWTSANSELLGAAVLTKLPFGAIDELALGAIPQLPVKPVLDLLRKLDLLEALYRATPTELFTLATHPDWRIFSGTAWRCILACQKYPELDDSLDRACSFARSTSSQGILGMCQNFLTGISLAKVQADRF